MSRKKEQKAPCCSVCGKAMPKAETWRGRILVCGKKACNDGVKAYGGESSNPKDIGAKQIRGSRYGCTHFVPEGYYQPNVRFPVCSGDCYTHRAWDTSSLICADPACAKEFRSREGCH